MSQADIVRIRETMNTNLQKAKKLFADAEFFGDLPKIREKCRREARRCQANAEHARQWLEDQGDSSIAA